MGRVLLDVPNYSALGNAGNPITKLRGLVHTTKPATNALWYLSALIPVQRGIPETQTKAKVGSATRKKEPRTTITKNMVPSSYAGTLHLNIPGAVAGASGVVEFVCAEFPWPRPAKGRGFPM